MSQQSFADLGLSADVVSVLAKRGIESPFQVQIRAIPAGLAGQDVLAKAPTGSGKTLAFAVPIVQLLTPKSPRPAALVLVPTRELAVQVTEELESLAPQTMARMVSPSLRATANLFNITIPHPSDLTYPSALSSNVLH